MKNTVERARGSIAKLSSDSQNEMSQIADYYAAATAYFSGDSTNNAAYKNAVEAVVNGSVPYHCLLRIPKDVDQQLAAAHVGQRLHVDRGLAKLRSAAILKTHAAYPYRDSGFRGSRGGNLLLATRLKFDVHAGLSVLTLPLVTYVVFLNRLSHSSCADASDKWHYWLPQVQKIFITLLLSGLVYLFIKRNLLEYYITP